MSCPATTTIPGTSIRVRCSRPEHGTDVWHRYQGSDGGVAFAVQWGDQYRRIGFAELNGLQTVLNGVAMANDDEIALGLAGWLADRPGVVERLRVHVPDLVRPATEARTKTARTIQNVLRGVGGNDRAVEVIQTLLDTSPEYGGDPNKP